MQYLENRLRLIVNLAGRFLVKWEPANFLSSTTTKASVMSIWNFWQLLVWNSNCPKLFVFDVIIYICDLKTPMTLWNISYRATSNRIAQVQNSWRSKCLFWWICVGSWLSRSVLKCLRQTLRQSIEAAVWWIVIAITFYCDYGP